MKKQTRENERGGEKNETKKASRSGKKREGEENNE